MRSGTRHLFSPKGGACPDERNEANEVSRFRESTRTEHRSAAEGGAVIRSYTPSRAALFLVALVKAGPAERVLAFHV